MKKKEIIEAHLSLIERMNGELSFASQINVEDTKKVLLNLVDEHDKWQCAYVQTLEARVAELESEIELLRSENNAILRGEANLPEETESIEGKATKPKRGRGK